MKHTAYAMMIILHLYGHKPMAVNPSQLDILECNMPFGHTGHCVIAVNGTSYDVEETERQIKELIHEAR